MKRRTFLHTSCYAAAAAMAGSRITNVAFAADAAASRDHLLVVVFLRGGCDALNLLGPANDRDFIAARPASLRVTDSGKHAGLPLKNGFAGVDMRLHNQAAPLKELYDSGDLAFVHACGLVNGTRSHSEAQDMMERGVADRKALALSTGWLTRTIDALAPSSLVPAVAVGGALPDSLRHSTVAISMSDAGDFTYGHESELAVLKRLYKGAHGIHREGRLTLETISTLRAKLPRKPDGDVLPYAPEKKAGYQEDSELAENLRTIAQLAKMELGLRVATVDYDGWDTHEYQEGRFDELVAELSRAIAAFYNDMTRFRRKMTVVIHSEFGRRLKSNQSQGTDHGYGGVHMVLGSGVKGGRMYGEWRGLANDQLDEGSDLAITTDYRTVLHEVLTRRVGLAETRAIFPGFATGKVLGLA